MMQIETMFLNRPNVKRGLNVQTAKSLIKQEKDLQKKDFALSLKYAKAIGSAVTWLKSKEGKNELSIQGLEWTQEDVFNNVFKVQRSQGQKLLKVSKMDIRVIEAFQSKCVEMETAPTLAKLIEFSNTINLDIEHSETATAEEIETAEAEAIESGEIAERVETVLTACLKLESVNISVRKDALNVVNTHNTKEELMLLAEAIKQIADHL